MAAPSVIKGTGLYIKIETSEGSGTFTHPCLINAERGVQFTSQTGETYVPDCDNPDLPAIRHIFKTGGAATITGEGVLDTAALSSWLAWMKADTEKAVQIWFGTIGHVPADFKLTGLDVTGGRDGYANVSVTLESHDTVGDYVAA